MGTKVNVDEKTLSLTNLEKVLYPSIGFTKGQVIDYYARVSETILPHLYGRCITTKRWPDGVEAESFFQKNCPKFHPSWINLAKGPGDNNSVEYCLVDSKASLVWLANLAALEFHGPMAKARKLETPTMVVFDLDPGESADISNCCTVALEIRDALEKINLKSFPKTSGGKGMQIYLPINTKAFTHSQASAFAKGIGEVLAKVLPDLVLTNMGKSLRKGKVLIDWSQNSHHKTTILPYSLRGRDLPYVSTPLTWEEVQKGSENKIDLKFLPEDVIQRIETHGDLFSETLTIKQRLGGE